MCLLSSLHCESLLDFFGWEIVTEKSSLMKFYSCLDQKIRIPLSRPSGISKFHLPHRNNWDKNIIFNRISPYSSLSWKGATSRSYPYQNEPPFNNN